jgi:hypothetical protein
MAAYLPASGLFLTVLDRVGDDVGDVPVGDRVALLTAVALDRETRVGPGCQLDLY